MAKRIVSGIFILTALGALGVIIAGAMTSGEQLIVRFLTAVTVAALALYVISDLRLQNEQAEPPAARRPERTKASAPQVATAVMATVTGSHRTARSSARHQAEHGRAKPNFEAIEPVTAKERTADRIDRAYPAATVVGSRLVPPFSDAPDRTRPPHPLSGTPADERASNPAPASPVSSSIAASATAGSPAAGFSKPDTADLADRIDEPEPFLPRDLETSGESVISTTTFTYSGRLAPGEADWPPQPPAEYVVRPSSDALAPFDKSATIDAPTAELPALRDLSTLETNGETLAPMKGSNTADGVSDEEWSGSSLHYDDDGHGPFLFAVDTVDDLTLGDDTSTGNDEPDRTDDPTDADDPTDTHDPTDTDDRAETVLAEVESGPTLSAAADAGASSLTPARSSTPTPTPIRENHPDKLTAAIRSGELQVINSLIAQGMLSVKGPITDRDVRTMVYVAFTSNELRKIIHAGGTPDGVRAGDLNLGPVELFDESRYAPTPKRLYSGLTLHPGDHDGEVLDLRTTDSGTPDEDAADVVIIEDGDASAPVPRFPTPRNLYRKDDTASRVEQ